MPQTSSKHKSTYTVQVLDFNIFQERLRYLIEFALIEECKLTEFNLMQGQILLYKKWLRIPLSILFHKEDYLKLTDLVTADLEYKKYLRFTTEVAPHFSRVEK